VSASGAMILLVPWKVSRTWLSTKSTTVSTKLWNPRGTSVAVALRAASQNEPVNNTPSNTEKKMLSRLKVQKPWPCCRLPRW
jgi:hypothetical protein